MLKKINRILKLVGLNLVRAKRKSPKWQKVPPHAEMTAPVNFKVPLADYMGDSEWHNAPGPEGPTGNVGCCGVKGPTPNPGRTHYVGDDCPGGHRDLVGAGVHLNPDEESLRLLPDIETSIREKINVPRVEQPNSDNKISGPTS